MSSEPPEEPHLRSEPNILSPASPKPIHFPAPTNIPVLEMQTDVGFNQTEAHMNDPAMHNTEVRPDVWRDKDEEDGVPVAAQHPNSDVDVQALLDTLQTAPASAEVGSAVAPTSTEAEPAIVDPQADESNGATPSVGVLPSGLPPRPPPQEQPLIHPNYVHSQHIRDYHPHASNPAFQPHGRTSSQGNVADPNSKNYVPPVHSPTSANDPQSTAYRVPNTASTSIPSNPYTANGQQTPIVGIAPNSYTPTSGQTSAFAASPQNVYGAQYPSQTNTPADYRRDRGFREGEQPRPEDRPWDAEVQRKYDRFIEDERGYVSEGRWEQFPQGSRLFVGNLSSEKVTKRDIFHVFHTYGDLAQISIKQAYGFVQFLRTEDCNRALHMEQGTQIRDKKIHLEVSKPQKNRTQNVQRRSRSPPDSGRGRPNSNVDRYVSGARGGNDRGGYRGYRSPSPRGYRDRHEDRYRRRSRSPDYNRGGRYRSPSPRREVDDDLPLPRRAPRDVPDVQIIVLDSLDRDFISWVEQAFSARGVRVDVLLLSPRLSEAAVVRRQIVEGVVAVVKLTKQNQSTSEIGLQIFDRRQGVNNVKFEEYEGLVPSTAVELVVRAKQTHGAGNVQTPSSYGGYGGGAQYGSASAPPPPPTQQSYPYGSYGAQPYTQPPPHTPGYPPHYNQAQHQPQPQQLSPAAGAPPPGVPPNLQHLITNLDPNNLQHLLSAMGSGTPQSAGSASYPASSSSLPNSAAMAALQSNPQLVGLLQQQQQQQQQQQAQGGSSSASGVNMQEILARLGTGQR